MRFFKGLIGCLVVAVVCSRANAWGSKEHIQLTRLAIEKLLADPTTPAGLKSWLIKNTPDLGNAEQERNYFLHEHVGAARNDLKGFSFWVIQPDVRSGDHKTGVPPCNVPEQMNHFIDMEYLNKDIDRHVYKHDLSNMPDITQAPRDPHDPRYRESGVLPFAIEYSYKNLVTCFKQGKMEPSVSNPGDEMNALKWAAFLAHYMEDNTQPLHNTQDYKCASYFADRRTAPNVHAEMEYRMADDEKQELPQLRADYWTEFTKDLATMKDPVTTPDLWMATLQVGIEGYRQIPLIGLAAMAASGEKGTPDHPIGRVKGVDTEKFFRFSSNVTGKQETVVQMKARQQAWAVIRVAHTLRRAWDEAHAK
ncbi:MAG: hypothetical protein ACTHM6_13510 [Tepidisphaeraceae bacterium]